MIRKSLFQALAKAVLALLVLVYMVLLFIARDMLPMSAFVFFMVLGFIAFGLILTALVMGDPKE